MLAIDAVDGRIELHRGAALGDDHGIRIELATLNFHAGICPGVAITDQHTTENGGGGGS